MLRASSFSSQQSQSGNSAKAAKRMDDLESGGYKFRSADSSEPGPSLSYLRGDDAMSASALAKRQQIFLFANPLSGGSAASGYTAAGIKVLESDEPAPYQLHIFDIREGESGSKPGFLALKRHTLLLKQTVPERIAVRMHSLSSEHGSVNPLKREELVDDDLTVYVIVCGGDGTVMWCISEIWAHEIDDSMIVIGVVPYGTGNDLARALGWQKFNAVRPFDGKVLSNFRTLIKAWLCATIVWHDIWEVTIYVNSNSGTFQKIDGKTRGKKTLPAEVVELAGSSHLPPQTVKAVKMKLCNYFSMGVESRVGIGFDRHRTSSQFCNKVQYGLEGMKKSMFRNTAPFDKFISRMTVGTAETKELPVFATADDDGGAAILSKARTLVALNIPSFAAGLDMWPRASAKALKVPSSSFDSAASAFTEPTQQLPSNTVVKPEVLAKRTQRMGDGLIEFLSFSGVPALGLERLFHNQGKRICQGGGPFNIYFNRNLSPQQRVYFQVDGEFFILTAPVSIHLTWLKRLKVLASSECVHSSESRFLLSGGPAVSVS